jgi:hypothetical protein
MADDATKKTPAKRAPKAAPTETLPTTSVSSDSAFGRFIDSTRGNRVGSLTAALAVALVVALVLSILVPGEPSLLPIALLGLLLAVAVGFAVRFFSSCHGLKHQVIAFVATVLGVHVMITTGTIHGSIGGGAGRGLGGGIGGTLGGIVEGLVPTVSYGDAMLGALATPAISSGGVLVGLVAAIIVGWGPRSDKEADAAS